MSRDHSYQKSDKESYSDEYYTPIDVVRRLEATYGPFTLDPCCTEKSAKAPKFYTQEDDGLAQDWTGEVVFCNPPYSNIEPWAIKCAEQAAYVSCLLIPCRTGNAWFQDVVIPNVAVMYFVRSRIQFQTWAQDTKGKRSGTPFYSVICVFIKGHIGLPIALPFNRKDPQLESLPLF